MNLSDLTETERWMLEMGWEDMTDQQRCEFCVEYQVGDELIQRLELKLRTMGL